ncbi:MAG: hypothetical protein ACI9MR_005010 [Myxococcota bacterium]|jgi:hypothetical protein
MSQPRVQVAEWLEHKAPLVQSWVRHAQALGLHHPGTTGAVKQEIQVEGSWSPPDLPTTSGGLLQPLKRIEQGQRRHSDPKPDHGIQVTRLGRSYRLRHATVRDRVDFATWNGAKPPHRPRQYGPCVTEIRAQSDPSGNPSTHCVVARSARTAVVGASATFWEDLHVDSDVWSADS